MLKLCNRCWTTVSVGTPAAKPGISKAASAGRQLQILLASGGDKRELQREWISRLRGATQVCLGQASLVGWASSLHRCRAAATVSDGAGFHHCRSICHQEAKIQTADREHQGWVRSTAAPHFFFVDNYFFAHPAVPPPSSSSSDEMSAEFH